MRRALTLLAVLVATAGCGDPTGPLGEATPDARAGTAADAGGSIDDTSADDAGERGDAAQDDAAGADVAIDDAARADAESIDAGSATPDALPALGPVLYPSGRRHSPITAASAARLRAIAGPGRRADVFAKIGDSITAGPSFLACFAGGRVDLGGRTQLQPTLDFFRAGDAAGATPYDRTSIAATVGWSASGPLQGSPDALAQELGAIEPRYGVVMFGTNDCEFRALQSFARDMLAIVDRMIAYGTIPLLSSIPPRDDSAAADARVPLFNLAVRAIAQNRGVPFVDFHQELLPLPAHGLSPDGVHPRSYSGGACLLTAAGLAFGSNVRNLLTLEQLDRARRAVDAEEAHDDEAAVPRLEGLGSPGSPYEVRSLPFAVLGDTRTSPHRDLARYSCSAADESGPELRYRFTLSAPARVTAAVASAAGADVDVHLLREPGAEADCIARNDRELSADLDAGTYLILADTYTSGGVEHAGEFLLLMTEE